MRDVTRWATHMQKRVRPCQCRCRNGSWIYTVEARAGRSLQAVTHARLSSSKRKLPTAAA